MLLGLVGLSDMQHDIDRAVGGYARGVQPGRGEGITMVPGTDRTQYREVLASLVGPNLAKLQIVANETQRAPQQSCACTKSSLFPYDHVFCLSFTALLSRWTPPGTQNFAACALCELAGCLLDRYGRE